MSKIQIDTGNDLERFLKILAEESVSLAKESVAEDAIPTWISCGAIHVSNKTRQLI